MHEVSAWFLGPFDPGGSRDPEAAGLRVVDLRLERLAAVFHDIGALVHYLRTVVWIVPDFTVDGYREKLRRLDAKTRAEGRFTAHATRFLIEAVKEVS